MATARTYGQTALVSWARAAVDEPTLIIDAAMATAISEMPRDESAVDNLSNANGALTAQRELDVLGKARVLMGEQSE